MCWRKREGLRVAGRTSSFAFKDKRDDLRADRLPARCRIYRGR